MSNIASALRSEVQKIARKEIRAQVDALKKANSTYRSGIADLKRQLQEVQRELRLLRKSQVRASVLAAPEVETDLDLAKKRRFSPARLARHREKLDLSAAAYARLVGVSSVTLSNWESGKFRPRPEQLQKLVEVRNLTKAAVAKLLEAEST